MRPDLTDLLSGVQRLLQGEIGPALADPFLQEQAAYASLLLEYAKKAWAREHLAIAAEHADLSACLTAVAAPLEALPGEEGRSLAREVRSALAATAPAAVWVAETELDRVLAVDRERRALLERALAVVESAADRHAADSPGQGALGGEATAASEVGAGVATARAAIDGYLVRAARRRDEVLATLGIAW